MIDTTAGPKARGGKQSSLAQDQVLISARHLPVSLSRGGVGPRPSSRTQIETWPLLEGLCSYLAQYRQESIRTRDTELYNWRRCRSFARASLEPLAAAQK